jgi:hypothetical protein
MLRLPAAFLTLSLGLAALTAALKAAGIADVADASAQSTPSLSVTPCAELDPGDTSTIALGVSGVTNLLAWEAYLAYDREIVEVIAREVHLFLGARPNSNVFDLSDPVPNKTGLYRLAAADLSLAEDSAESGAGIIATITVLGKREGVSAANIFRADLDGDTTIDIGPTLTSKNGKQISDFNGDRIFDGPLFSGQIAVGVSCGREPPSPPPVLNPPSRPLDRDLRPSPTTDANAGSPGNTPPNPVATATPLVTEEASGALPAPTSTTDASVREGVAATPPGNVPGGPAAARGSGSISNWLIALIASAAGSALVLVYIIVRTARRGP